ncbi:hypothetical protein [Haloferula sargassicola]|uniref:Laminin IV type A domain-containing protein n=1 Tax=Haloferula sargassicola TaxID=490096 RepID=A0ABP9UNH0_9BACT
MRCLLFFLIVPFAHADALAGAWETFPTQNNNDAWNLYSYDDELVAPPLWADTEVDPNPYAYSYFLGGEGVWFFADEFTAGGALVGDYGSVKISAVDVSVSIDPAEIDNIDLAIYANGPAGPGYYFSELYLPEDLGTEPDWYGLRIRFDDLWYYFEETGPRSFTPSAAFLNSIEEVGLRVFPVSGVSNQAYVGIDDFILVPTVDAPGLSPAADNGTFTLSFTPNPGVSATIQTLDPGSSWEAIPGQTALTGPQTYRTAADAARKFFRVTTKEHLTQVVSP